MTLALFLAALCRHPFAIAFTGVFLGAIASLSGLSVPLTLAVWVGATVFALEVWYCLETPILHRLCGTRRPSHAELELLDTTFSSSNLQPVISEQPGFVVMRGMRCLIVGRDVLDVFEPRALTGVLYQAALSTHRAELAGAMMVWLGALPLVIAWLVSRACNVFGRLLGLVVGEGLVLPLVLWRDGFLCWSARVFGAIIAGVLGATLLADGFAAAGFDFAMAWLAIPIIKLLLAWESRRTEAAADRETTDAGYGWQLLEALELLVVAGPTTRLGCLLAALQRPGGDLVGRAERIRAILTVTS